MRSCFTVLFFLPILALAQKAEIGATIGGGAFGAEDTGSPAYVLFGVEGCGFCSRSVALFGEYNHWQKAGTDSRYLRINSVDMVAGGARFQFGKSFRPFVDLGVAGGWDRYEYLNGKGSHGNPGMVFGVGVAKVFQSGWYVRPQLRVYVLRGIHAGLVGSVGIGYRF